jgi:hypothetical protein
VYRLAQYGCGSWLSCTVLAVLFSSEHDLPVCPVPAVLYWLSCSGYPILAFLLCCPCFWQFFSGCPVLGVLFWLAFSGCSFLVVLFWVVCSGWPFLAVLFWLSCSGFFSCSGCPVLSCIPAFLFYGFPALAVLLWLSFSGCAVPAVLFWLSCSGFTVLAVLFWLFCFMALQFPLSRCSVRPRCNVLSILFLIKRHWIKANTQVTVLEKVFWWEKRAKS